MKTKIFFLLVSLLILSVFYFGCPHPIAPAPVNDHENTCKKVASPVFSPEQGEYDTAQSVTISCATKEAVIRYTTDGLDPVNNSTVYTNPIIVSTSMTIKAIAYRSRYKESNIVTAVYTIGKKVAAPVFTPPAGSYSTVQNVEISCSTEEAIIRYTTDGSVPDENSTEYTEPVIVDSTMTIKAIAFKADYSNSNISEAAYTFIETVAAPIFSKEEGIYNEDLSLAISCPTDNATIRYTTDGTVPNETSTQYTAAISINVSVTIKAIAYKAGCIESSIASADYILVTQPPAMNHASGIYTTNMEIIFNSPTPDAIVKYTLDGTDPKTSSTAIIGNSFTFTRTVKVISYAYKPGWQDSAIIVSNFTYRVAPPNIYPAPQAFDNSFTCTLATYSSGATIKYTLDGNNPVTSNTAVIGNSVIIPQPTLIQAYAYKEGCIDSSITAQNYFFKVKMPVIIPNSGTYSSPQTVVLACETAAATVKYTTDGSDPKTSATAVIGTSLIVNSSKTVKAYAYKPGYTDSETATASYIINNVPSTIAYRDMAYVPGGTFIQGNVFQHTISPFFMGKYEVTYELWYTVRIWAQNKGYSFFKKGNITRTSQEGVAPTESTKYRPVCYVSRADVIVWCNAYSEMSGLTPCYFPRNSTQYAKTANNDVVYICDWTKNGYRLPTEGEWELTARYKDGTNWTPINYPSCGTTYSNDIRDLNQNGIPDGKESNDAVAVYAQYWNGTAWVNTGVTETACVGTKSPNALDIYDMAGNVCEHLYDEYSDYPTTPQVNYRGTSYYYNNHYCFRSAGLDFSMTIGTVIATGERYTNVGATEFIYNFGLRVALNIQ